MLRQQRSARRSTRQHPRSDACSPVEVLLLKDILYDSVIRLVWSLATICMCRSDSAEDREIMSWAAAVFVSLLGQFFYTLVIPVAEFRGVRKPFYLR